MKIVSRRLSTAVAAAVMAVSMLSGCTGSGSGPGAGSAPRSAGEAPESGLDDPAKKEIAMQLVSSAENSSLDWKAQYEYIEDIDDGRGYTAGIIGFCSGTGDMLKVVERYTAARPSNPLQRFLPALRAVLGSDAHDGLGGPFTEAWAAAATDPAFRAAQDAERDRSYFDPAVTRAEADGLGALGQFIYYDAYVMHGYGDSDGTVGFRTIRREAIDSVPPPARGGDEAAYLNAFLDARVAAMRKERSHSDTSRVETAQQVFVHEGRFGLETPLRWRVYGDSYRMDAPPNP
ncbi:chitosanase [Streptomyces sp. NBC_01221]|uniref:chitosanase n=1 Tax=Streptomyces sp. NBC_01221 TaxID=2903782 RepID=UPI00224F9405|nr:chitosanase [Streptomyces sp. NBC_01221]MCX4790243.1 chitosanase [Streptomyces sp. NBC_01221]